MPQTHLSRMWVFNQQNWSFIKNRWKIGKLWNFETSWYETLMWFAKAMQMTVDDVIASQFLKYNLWNLTFFIVFSRLIQIYLYITVCFSFNNQSAWIVWGTSESNCTFSVPKKMEFLLISVQKEWRVVRRWHLRLAHLHTVCMIKKREQFDENVTVLFVWFQRIQINLKMAQNPHLSVISNYAFIISLK